jgi:hypothetical protein
VQEFFRTTFDPRARSVERTHKEKTGLSREWLNPVRGVTGSAFAGRAAL